MEPSNTTHSAKPGCVIWFTGLPSSGKTTLSLELKSFFDREGIAVEHLDGDVVRAILPGTGFSKDERNNHIRRMGFMASRLEHHGVVVIASFVSPYRESRDFARNLCNNFVEVYLATDIEECTKRDVKGMYKEAKSGQRQSMTGIDDPYEAPQTPELTIDTSMLSVEQSVGKILSYLSMRRLISYRQTERVNKYGSYIAA
jgi:adenylylsulfate kinase